MKLFVLIAFNNNKKLIVVGKSEEDRYDFDRQKRKLFSKLTGSGSLDVDEEEDEVEDQKNGVRSELEALRSSGQVKNLFRSDSKVLTQFYFYLSLREIVSTKL
jgi:hypothetical protein